MAGFTVSTPPHERSQGTGDPVATAVGGLAAVLGEAEKGCRREQADAGEGVARVGPGGGGRARRASGRRSSRDRRGAWGRRGSG